jgi:hypothetical protein
LSKKRLAAPSSLVGREEKIECLSLGIDRPIQGHPHLFSLEREFVNPARESVVVFKWERQRRSSSGAYCCTQREMVV